MKQKYLSLIVDALKEKKLDAILVAPSEELDFLAGFNPYLCERFQGLFIKKDGTYFYICNILARDEMKLLLGEKAKVYSWSDSDGFMPTVEDAFLQESLLKGKIAVNSTARAFNILTIAEKTATQFVDGRPILEQMRLIKTPEEMEALRESAAIVDASFEELLKFIKIGVSEKEITQKMTDIFLAQGLTDCNVLACVGGNSSYPHYCGSDGVVKYGDVVLLDWGCRHKNMWSDMSRTVFVGEVSERQKEIYNIVKKAQKAGTDTAVKGAFIPDVDKAARNVIIEEGYGDEFITRLGHGIGFSVHEGPYISQSNHNFLDIGMAFSIEPGIYLAGELGIRIEDVVLVGPSGTEILNKATKEITVIS